MLLGLEGMLSSSGSSPWLMFWLTRAAPSLSWQAPHVAMGPSSTGKVRLLSLGADGKRGGEGANADISVDR